MHNYTALIGLGLAVGTFGTMIGAGGGFILAPVLLLLYPHEDASIITFISLAVTCANATSGSIAYGRMGCINYRYGLIFAAASIPGAIVGALATHYVERRTFDLVFACILIAISIFVFLKSDAQPAGGRDPRFILSRSRLWLGIGVSAVVGVVSSFLGIGGGIIHVPFLVHALDFPVHVATATSHFILAIMAFIGTLAHIASGSFEDGLRRALALGVGVLIGAQIGARLSAKVHGRFILRFLAAALFFVGARLLVLHLSR